MSGLEVIVGLEKMTINQCQELAKKLDFDGATFDLCGPKGKMPCKWLDAYFGMFIIDGAKGFTMVSQLQFAADLWCENLQIAAVEMSSHDAAYRSSALRRRDRAWRRCRPNHPVHEGLDAAPD